MLKIKGTDLDRSKKLTSEDIAWCKQMKKEGYTYAQIGKVFNVTGPCIRYNLISTKERRELNDKKNAAKRNWWHSLPKEKRAELGKKWNDSTNAYKAELIETKINNMCK